MANRGNKKRGYAPEKGAIQDLFNKSVGYPASVWDNWLEVYAQIGIKTEACKQVGVSISGVAKRAAADPEFARRMEEARQYAIGVLERAVYQRAVEGVEEPIFNSKGDQIGHKINYSDTLLKMALQANAPEKYKNQSAVEVSGPQGGAISVAHTLTPAVTKILNEILEPSDEIEADNGQPKG